MTAPAIAHVEPKFGSSRASFVGAALPVCGVDVLIVVVRPSILADVDEASLYVVAFGFRFKRTIVLMAQDEARVPTYFGPANVVRAISVLPFEIIPWQRLLFRVPKPPPFRLPIPPEQPPDDSTGRYDSSIEGSIEEMTKALLQDRAASRMACTTKR